MRKRGERGLTLALALRLTSRGALAVGSELGELTGEVQARLQLDGSAWQDVTEVRGCGARGLFAATTR